MPNFYCLSQAAIWVFIVLLCCFHSVTKQKQLDPLCQHFLLSYAIFDLHHLFVFLKGTHLSEMDC